MRVLAAIVVPPHMSVSGGARAGERLSEALAPSCHIQVASMLPRESQSVSSGDRVEVRTWLPAGVPWVRIPRRYATLFYRSDIPARIREGGFDLVHIHNPMPALEMERIARAARQVGIPYVVSTHGFNEIARGNEIYGFDAVRRLVWRKLAYAPVRRVARHAAAVFALSPADCPILAEMGVAEDRIHIVPNGVETPAPADPDGDAAICRRFGLPAKGSDGRITCMFLANHTPNKGLPVLLEAFRRIKRPYRLIVGGEKRAEIDYAALAAPIESKGEIIVTGRLADDEVAALMRRSDIFVFPTLADTFPLVVLEAMAHGLPVIASTVGGIPFQLGETCGLLVPAGRADALAEAVETLAADPERRAEFGRQARARASEIFTWNAAARAALSGYERVLQRQTRADRNPLAIPGGAMTAAQGRRS